MAENITGKIKRKLQVKRSNQLFDQSGNIPSKILEDPLLPLDNNDAERSIKSFCVGKHSWHIIDSTKGAKASALLYSIAESAKQTA
nr:transposase [Blautia sp. OF11-22]